MNTSYIRRKKKKDEGLRINEAIVARDTGQLQKSARLFYSAIRINKKSSAAYLLLGGVLLKQNKITAAIKAFQEATKLSPNSELASLGLFHGLWKKGFKDKAFLEMLRFITRKESEEYGLLLKDLGDDVRKGPI